MCTEEIFHKSREVETLAYELADILKDKDPKVASLAAEIKSGAYEICELADKLRW